MSIPKPLVQINQLFLVITVILGVIVSPWILWLPFVVGVIALAFRKNLIMITFQSLLKKPADTYPPEDADQQRFNQWIATICIGIAILTFATGFSILGLIFSIMVVVAAGLALCGFCIGCTIRYRYLMWKHKQQNG
ncbi:DUF4395 domain-containing protein [Halalkalibacterium halodurans]|uniref:BH1782 protein n=1 Tax=Halalkalibacterium halodurans (strain ATCC BAA-125 / DSM 18197 / FERM 7344 / JCM 9153 / C-125) TaxID=272558 RepID=Q9KBZ2_HALH5|nr:DUF4395 domain-containing protein [Halalkalibacterium halodurans]MED4082351.1 DUF4395 domain-containing protein [Halalkalibacterium halodurans]MED4083498.1 DUF4395 domain-containing protein [Halalkalibacterium halodurans]MED4105811.1 DUF4395 domain-containing protein [Halalkalibacterium halodurans]MED4109923.1 DUF4395 domain-containing protein [Halalkalibacterium halodurans]MED4149264.1 DUF4395 domain-containing protein [Halalkalibacterium halodurans]